MTQLAYSGIGSRETPSDVLERMFEAAAYLAQAGLILRSGGADGADMAFENGCDWGGGSGSGAKQIFLPWPGFNGNQSPLTSCPNRAYSVAARFHPAWWKLTQPVMNIMARNTLQVLGPDLNSPSAFVLCWTKGGQGGGGTGQALRIARAYDIPIFDFGRHSLDHIEQGISIILNL